MTARTATDRHPRRATCARRLLLAAVAVLGAACGTGSASAASANQLVAQGLAAQKAGKLAEAFADYKAAARESPDNKFALFDLGDIYQQRGEAAKAAAEYLAALRADPRFAPALYNMGVLQTKSNPTSAIDFYRRELAVDPSDASGNFNLGVLLAQHGQVGAGDAYIERAISLNPAFASELPPGVSLPTATTATTTTTRP